MKSKHFCFVLKTKIISLSLSLSHYHICNHKPRSLNRNDLSKLKKKKEKSFFLFSYLAKKSFLFHSSVCVSYNSF